MRPLLSLVVSSLFFLLMAFGASAETLRIVTWNMEWFPGNKPDAGAAEKARQMKEAKAALEKLNPDVFLMQEVRDEAAAREVCSAVPGLEVRTISAFKDSQQNVVVASKLPADSGWFDYWKAGVIHPTRGYSFSALKLPGGQFLLTYSLHLKSNRGDLGENIAQRQESVRQLIPHLQDMLALYGTRGPCAVVVAGDLNTSLDDPKFKDDQSLRTLLEAGLYWTHNGVAPADRTSLPAEGEFPATTFDHVLTAGLGAPKSAVFQPQAVSDHNPVIVEVDLGAADFKVDLKVDAVNSLPLPSESLESVATLEVGQREQIVAAAGKRVTINGVVSVVGTNKQGTIHFVNFQGTKRDDFVTIIRKNNYDAVIQQLGITGVEKLHGKKIQVKGTISMFGAVPEIEVSQADQIVIVP